MNSRLEKFVRNHRAEFDSDEPDPQLWKKLEQQLHSGVSDKKLHRMMIIRWSAVAAVTILATLGVFYFTNKPATNGVAGNGSNIQTNEIMNAINPVYAKEVYHFTQLIELKQTELKKIAKEQPALYNEFIGDITTLDSSYNALKKELPQNPNREQLLEAMIENLRLQTDLLNHQLLIIKKIKQTKTISDEKNSKSI
ncbi:MAG: hypothetical protein H7122_02825 [Chitinophagaceae bacterium]|nr:hypothetical protein [Chitinophagaceae bacterium]